MTLEDLKIVSQEDTRRAVAENISRDPLAIALDGSVAHAKLVASQVKYLQRARVKLPSYYATQCIIPSLAFEQSSSELTAANKHFAGSVCLDLTCGLGVDTLHLARGFERVVALERDSVLAEVARINFGLLGVENVEVVNSSAESYLADNPTLCVDMIYVDPDRRGADGKKLVALSDCSPNVLALMETLKKVATKVVVKLSPMFDIDEVFRLFGEGSRVEVVSLGGECKEILVEVDGGFTSPTISAVAIGIGRVEYPFCKHAPPPESRQPLEQPKYLIAPDVALAKAGVAMRYFEEQGAYIESDNSFAFTNMVPETIFGKLYEIEYMYPYVPKKLRQELKASGIKRIDILKRNFPHSTSDIARQLGVVEGGEQLMAFACVEGQRYALSLKMVSVATQ